MNEGLLIPKTLDYAVCQRQYHKDDSSEIKNKSLEMINGTFYHIIQREVLNLILQNLVNLLSRFESIHGNNKFMP